MSNFHAVELDVIRWTEARAVFGHTTPERQSLYTVGTVGELCDAIAQGASVDHISDAMGRVAIDLIVLCAMVDIDLAKSLETAFNKISAKPVDTSNVVLLKRE